MPTISSYGGSFNSGVTWTDAANIYDGNSTTYGYYSAAVDLTLTGDVLSYGFQSGGANALPAEVAEFQVDVQIWFDVANITKWSSVSVQAFNNTTALGTPVSITSALSTSDTNNITVTLNGITLNDIRSSNFKVRITAVRTGTLASVFYLRQITTHFIYTASTGVFRLWTGTQWKSFVIWNGTSWSSNYKVWNGDRWITSV